MNDAQKFQRYAEALGGDVGLFFNRTIEKTLEAGIKAAVLASKHDSSRAAAHWIFVPKGGGFRPSARKEATFNPEFGTGIVGRKGDKGSRKDEVAKEVADRELRKVIKRALSTSYRRAGKGATVFALYNATPEVVEGETVAGNDYITNANLRNALAAAHEIMNEKFLSEFMRGNLRQRPIGGDGMAGNPFKTL